MLPRKIKSIIFYGVTFAALRMLVGATSVVFLLSKNLSLQDIGLLKSFQALLVLFLDIPLSYFSDKFSRKFSISIATLLASFWLLTTAFAQNLTWLYLAESFNAISLALFNGAFISYLVDFNNRHIKKIATEKLLARFYQYETLAMALCAFFGSAFTPVHANTSWWIAGFSLLLLFFAAPFLLSSDNNQKFPQKTPTLFLIKKDLHKIASDLRQRINVATLLGLMVLLSFYMQLIIQFWQILIQYENDAKNGLVFGILFNLILLVQSFSSYCVGKGWLQKHMNAVLFMLIAAPCLLFFQSTSLVLNITAYLFAILFIFFSAKACMIHFSSRFHDAIDPEYRSTFDSMISVSMRLLVIISFPIVSTLGQHHVFYFVFFFVLSALMVLFFYSRIKSEQ